MSNQTEIEQILKSINDKITVMESSIPKIVDPMTYGMHSKTHYKLQILRELSFLRVFDFATNGYLLLKNEKIIPAMLMVRATLETLSHFYFVIVESRKVINNQSISDSFIKKIDRLLLGNKLDVIDNEEHNYKPIHIMDCIRALDNDYDNILDDYNFLSEFCHPNDFGLLNAYSKFNAEKFYSELNISHLANNYPHLFALKSLNNYLVYFLEFYDITLDIIKEISEITKQEVENENL